MSAINVKSDVHAIIVLERFYKSVQGSSCPKKNGLVKLHVLCVLGLALAVIR